MKKGFVFALGVGFVLALAFYLDTAQAGTTQRGSWNGESNAGAVAVIGGDTSHSTVNAPKLNKRVPDVVAPSFPTAYECGKGVSGGFGVAGFGGTAGGVIESEECNTRADAAYAAKLGDHITAREMMCAKERYYLANKRAQMVYARLQRPYVDKDGMPLACLPNEDYDVVYRDDRNAKRERAQDPHHGAFHWQNEEQ